MSADFGSQYLSNYLENRLRDEYSRDNLLVGPDKTVSFLDNNFQLDSESGKKFLVIDPNTSVNLALDFKNDEFPLSDIEGSDTKKEQLIKIFNNGWYSVRSRIAVYVGDVIRFSSVEILRNEEAEPTFRVNIEFKNYSKNPLRINEGDDILRVFIPPKNPLKGRDLYDAVRSMDGQSIYLITAQGQEYSLARIRDIWTGKPNEVHDQLMNVFFNPKSSNPFTKVRLYYDLNEGNGYGNFPSSEILDLGNLPISGEDPYILWQGESTDTQIQLRRTYPVKRTNGDVCFVIDKIASKHGQSVWLNPNWPNLNIRERRWIGEHYYDGLEDLNVPDHFDAMVYEFEEVE